MKEYGEEPSPILVGLNPLVLFGNWLDEQAFDLDSEINVVPVSQDELFFTMLPNCLIPCRCLYYFVPTIYQ